MARIAAESPTAPPAIRLLLLALLPLFALLLYLDGQIHDSDLLDLGKTAGEGGASAALFPERIDGLERVGRVRWFNDENLYEYINGHAEYYLGAGFEGLTVGEYGAGDDGQPKVVVNLYDMGGALNAFGVLVEEAGDQESAPVGSLGFRGGQGINFIQGPYYVQVSFFDSGPDPLTAATAIAARLAERTEGAELAFRFPELGTVKSTRFVREYYRGMEFFNKVVERSFERDGQEIQAFVISAPAAEIGAIERSLTAFLSDDGIPFEAVERNGLRLVVVADPYEGSWFYVTPVGQQTGQLVGVYAPLDDGMVEAVAKFSVETLSDSAGARFDLRQ